MENNQSKYGKTFDFKQEERYERAVKRVKQIKGFYTHLIVYVAVNIGLIALRARHFDELNADLWKWQTWNTAFFWGIGLVAHAGAVFGKDLFLGKDWEKRKLEQFMKEEEEKQQQWK